MRWRTDFVHHADIAAECTHYSREVCEMAVAHLVKDKTEAAYREYQRRS
ncbi:MAG: hypothetical protein ACXWCP_20420 [Burkholderiales bacterium]